MQRSVAFALGFLGALATGFLALSFAFLLNYIRELSSQSAPFDPTPTLAAALETMLVIIIVSLGVGYVASLIAQKRASKIST